MPSAIATDTETPTPPAPHPRADWIAFFDRFKTTPHWALPIGLINLIGIIYGFYYYRQQFAYTPITLWWIVPDSPLAVLWAQLALIGYWLTHTRPNTPNTLQRTLEALAIIGNIQVGLWTVYVLLAYADQFGTYTLNLNTILLAGHAAMALLALIFLHGQRRARTHHPKSALIGLGLATTYYLINDALDYFGPDYKGQGCGTRPYTVPCDATMEPTLAIVTISLTLASATFLYLTTRPPKPRPKTRSHTTLDDTP